MTGFIQQSRRVVESASTGALLVSEASDLPHQFLDKDRILQSRQWELPKLSLLFSTLISFSNRIEPDSISRFSNTDQFLPVYALLPCPEHLNKVKPIVCLLHCYSRLLNTSWGKLQSLREVLLLNSPALSNKASLLLPPAQPTQKTFPPPGFQTAHGLSSSFHTQPSVEATELLTFLQYLCSFIFLSTSSGP